MYLQTKTCKRYVIYIVHAICHDCTAQYKKDLKMHAFKYYALIIYKNI